MIRRIFQDTDSLTLTVTIFLAIAGWVFALWLQGRNIRSQHRIQIRYEIYKQLVQLHKDTQDAISSLTAHSRPPFILMESKMIPFDLKLKKEYKDIWLPYSEEECVFEGEKTWSDFTQKGFAHYFDFLKQFQKLMRITEDWDSALEPILPIKDILNKEINKYTGSIYANLQALQSYSHKEHDWRKWDREEVEQITQSINDSGIVIGMYLHDFMVLVHNELLSSYFGHQRPTRKTLVPEYKVLTKKGIVENIDHSFVAKTEKCKAQLTALATEKLQKITGGTQDDQQPEVLLLQTIIEGTCPNCQTSLLVIESVTRQDGQYFKYGCGHELTITNENIPSKNRA